MSGPGISHTRFCVAVGLLVACAASGEENARASYGALDPAQVPCPVLVRMNERAPRGTEQQFYTWLLGYVAGRIAENPDGPLRPLPATGPERARYYGELLGFCRGNPQGTFGKAVDQLLDEVTAPR